MNIRKTYWIVSLSLLLSFSMLLPFCCDAIPMQSMDHHSEMASHTTHGQSETQSCECGHELAKDYQKNKKIGTSQILPVINAVILSDELQNPSHDYFSSRLTKQPPGLLKKSGLSIHLLNSVFLN